MLVMVAEMWTAHELNAMPYIKPTEPELSTR